MFKEIWYGLNAFAGPLFAKVMGMSWEDFSYGSAQIDLGEEVTKVEKTERKYDKRRFLKIKLKSLMAEVKIIREQEEKLKPAAMRGSEGARTMIEEMATHRRKDIREESRATLLAYNFIRGRTYQETEPNAKREASFYMKNRVEKVAKMAHRYGQIDWNIYDAGAYQTKIRMWMGLTASYEKE